MERLSINQRHGMGKVVGTALGVAGALLCTFVQGPAMYTESRKEILHGYKQRYSRADWMKGSLIILAANGAWCVWFIMQVGSMSFLSSTAAPQLCPSIDDHSFFVY